MKKLIVFILSFIFTATAIAQNPSYQEKLYYTCKVWGFLKYFHSKVSVCEVNWDSVLVNTLPIIKNTVTVPEFNDALYTMLQAAGPMDIATTPSPDTLPPELKRNLNFGWINDQIFRSDVKEILDTIKNNFRPHEICWVKNNNYLTSYKGWLVFPYDSLMINSNLNLNYPDENTRILIFFKYWNIINYFNPYNYILDTPWDSTLNNNILSVVNADDYKNFVLSINKISAKLDDAHVQGLTYSSQYFFAGRYSPRIILRYTQNDYVVVKTGEPEIAIGDIIESIGGKTISQVEDSLGPYISAGNPNVFRRFMAIFMILGDSSSQIQIGYKDSAGISQSISLPRNYRYDTWFTDYYPCDSLKEVKWKKYDCNVGYVNMGILINDDVNYMYNELFDTKAIIFDIRNYPNSTAPSIATLLYQNRMCFAKFTKPDVSYPGTYYWSESWLGNDANPVYYKGKIIILCNQETQSHAEWSCMVLRAMPNSVIVGSQTAGADGNISSFKLSQDIRAGFTSLGTFYCDGTETQRIGIVPDSVVYPTAVGIRKGRDEVLEKAFEIAGCVVSVDEKEIAKSELTISPNPVSDNLIINYSLAHDSNINVKISNELGLSVYEIENINSNSVNINTDNFSSGVYFLTIKAGNNSETRKFVIIR